MPTYPKRNQSAPPDTLQTTVFTANAQTWVIDVTEFNSIAIQATVAGTLTYAFEGSLDGTNFATVQGLNVTTGAVVGSTVANPAVTAIYRFNVTGFRFFRARVTAYTSTGTLAAYRDFFVADDPSQNTPLAAGSNTIGNVGLVAGSAIVGDVGGAARSATGGIALTSRLVSAAASTNATVVKGSAGRIYKIRGYNAKASVVYLKLYNKATAPTVGTDTPVLTFALKPSDVFDIDFGDIGYYFATGIGFALTGAAADADTTALVAADVVGLNVSYT